MLQTVGLANLLQCYCYLLDASYLVLMSCHRDDAIRKLIKSTTGTTSDGEKLLMLTAGFLKHVNKVNTTKADTNKKLVKANKVCWGFGRNIQIS
jgi:hypothetical protein